MLQPLNIARLLFSSFVCLILSHCEMLVKRPFIGAPAVVGGGGSPSPAPQGNCQMNPQTNREVPTFQKHIRPLVQKHCTICHDVQTPHVGIYSDLKGGTTAQAISSIKSGDMPPPAMKDALRGDELQLLEDWLKAGFPEDTDHCPTNTSLLPPAPTCTINADAILIGYDQATNLNYVLSGSFTSATWEDGTAINPTVNLPRSIKPLVTQTYRISVTGLGGSSTCTAKITVVPPPAPTCTLTASPTSLTANQTSRLTMTTSGVVSNASLDGTAVSIAGGTKDVTAKVNGFNDSKAFLGSVNGLGGSNSCSVQINIVGLPPPPPAPTCTLTVSSAFVQPGGSSTLTLMTTGGSTTTVLDGVAITANPFTKTVTPAASTTFNAVVTGPGGSGSCSQAVTVAAVHAGLRNPKFGMLVNEVRCSFCHMKMFGDLASTREGAKNFLGIPSNIMEFKNAGATHDSGIEGKVLSASKFNPVAGSEPQNLPLPVRDGIINNYRGPELPIDKNGNGVPDFPMLNYTSIANGVSGNVSSVEKFPQNVSKIYNGNLVLIGTQANPIKINGDILVKGDLIIRGYYQGIGTIYATGRIYIPSNLRAMNWDVALLQSRTGYL